MFIRRNLYIFICIFCISFSIPAKADIKKVLYNGETVSVNVVTNMITSVYFPEPIIQVKRGDGAKFYQIRRIGAYQLNVTPWEGNDAYCWVIGMSGEHYPLNFIHSEDYNEKVYIEGTGDTIDKLIHKVSRESYDPPEVIKEEVQISDNQKNLSTEKEISPQDQLYLPSELIKRITLKGNNIPLSIYLNSISSETGFNVMMSEGVENKTVSINLQDLEIWRALKTLLYPLSYGYRITENDIIVLAREMRVFDIAIPPVEQTIQNTTSNQSFTTSGNSQSNSDSGGLDVEIGGKVFVESQTPVLSAWNDLEQSIQSLITPNKGSYSLLKSSGKAIVTDLPGVLDRIASFIHDMNESLSRQQGFEIQIVKVTLTDEHESGVDWNVLGRLGAMDDFSAQTNFNSTGFTSGQFIKLSMQGPHSGSGITENGINSAVQALSTMGKVEVIEKPNLVCTNLQPCVFLNGTSKGIIDGAGELLSDSATTNILRTKTIHGGLTMQLLPHIGKKGDPTMLTMAIDVSEIKGIDTFQNGNQIAQTPETAKQNIQTTVSVGENELLVIGGLITNNVSDVRTGIPFLSQFPILGKAFSHTERINNKEELIIMIAPKEKVVN